MNKIAAYYCILVVGVFLLICMCSHDINNFVSKEYVTGRDGKRYPVVGLFKEEKEAANLLADINTFLISMIKNMKKKYVINRQGGQYELTATLILLDRYNPDVLFENNPKGTKNTSYVAGKGKSIGFCLREKASGEDNLHKWGIVQFVALHEISHIITEEYGHEPEFWQNFKFLIGEAIDAGLYTPVDYRKTPETYCGVLVAFSPYYDPSLA